MMIKRKLHQVAKDFNVSSIALISMLNTMGYKVNNHMAPIDDETLEIIKNKFEEQKEEIRKNYALKRKWKEESDRKLGVTAKSPREGEGVGGGGVGSKKKKKWKTKPLEINQKEIKDNIKKTLAKIGSGDKIAKKKYRVKLAEKTEIPEGAPKIKVSEFVSVSELAGLMNVKPVEVLTKALELGMMVTINQRLDHESIAMIADEFGFVVELLEEYSEDILEEETDETEQL